MAPPRKDKRPSSGYRKPTKAAVMTEVLALMKPEPLLAPGTSQAAKTDVIEALAQCGDLELAAAACDMALSDVNMLARTDDNFRQRLTTARAKFMGERVKEVVSAAGGPKGDFRAATWLLERLDRTKFAPPKQTIEQHVTLDVGLMTDAQLLEAAGITEPVDTQGEDVTPSGDGKNQENPTNH